MGLKRHHLNVQTGLKARWNIKVLFARSRRVPGCSRSSIVGLSAGRTIFLKVDPRLFSALLADKRLSIGSFKLWHLLYSMTGKNTCCWPSVRTLARRMNVSPVSIGAWIKELRDCGYVKIVKGNRHSSNQYVVSPKVPPGAVSKSDTGVLKSDTPVSESSIKGVSGNVTQLIPPNEQQEKSASKDWIKQLRAAVNENQNL